MCSNTCERREASCYKLVHPLPTAGGTAHTGDLVGCVFKLEFVVVRQLQINA